MYVSLVCVYCCVSLVNTRLACSALVKVSVFIMSLHAETKRINVLSLLHIKNTPDV